MRFTDKIYDSVVTRIENSNVPDDIKNIMLVFLNSAYKRCNPIRLANKGCGE